jgi:hypothetical protein
LIELINTNNQRSVTLPPPEPGLPRITKRTMYVMILSQVSTSMSTYYQKNSNIPRVCQNIMKSILTYQVHVNILSKVLQHTTCMSTYYQKYSTIPRVCQNIIKSMLT